MQENNNTQVCGNGVALSVSTLTIDKAFEMISSKDQVISSLNSTINSLREELVETKSSLNEALRNVGKIIVERSNGWFNTIARNFTPETKTVEDFKKEIEEQVKKSYEEKEENAIVRVKELENTNDELKREYDLRAVKLESQLDNKLEESKLQYERRLKEASKKYDLLNEKYEALKEGKEFETKEAEIKALKDLLKKANSRLINFGAITSWLKK